MMLRTLALVCVSLFLVASAFGEEAINRFAVDIDVERDGDIVVTEQLTVTAEGREIRRGLLRDLPRYARDDQTGGRLPYRYEILSVTRDGERENFEVLDEGNAKQIRIGNANVFLEPGRYIYEIRYVVKNQIRYFDTFDEIYWNATGSYWAFPIEEAQARIRLPSGARIVSHDAYTGRLGAAGNDYRYVAANDSHTFTTTRVLDVREGLTVSLAFEKGLIDGPSFRDKRWLWWARNGALAILFASFMGLFGFYYRSFDKVGRDPVKGPVFPQYAPPEGYSPAAAHHIYYRGLRGHKALVASLMQLGVKGVIEVDVEDKTFGKDVTKLSLKGLDNTPPDLSADSLALAEDLFDGRSRITLDGTENKTFTRDYTRFRKRIVDRYGSPYFKWNIGYLVLGVIGTVGALIFAINQANVWTHWHNLGILALVVLNGVFMYLIPAPTRKGQKIRTEIEGFKLYMETAEKLQLNAVEVGSEAPPPMTTERYEAFLPYAVALGVEKPWTKHFERLIPEEAANYNPHWSNMSGRSFGSVGSMTKGIVSGVSSGVSGAMPQSSGSSGSGGGGFSGGGGGGGGGGGW